VYIYPKRQLPANRRNLLQRNITVQCMGAKPSTGQECRMHCDSEPIASCMTDGWLDGRQVLCCFCFARSTSSGACGSYPTTIVRRNRSWLRKRFRLFLHISP